MSAIQGLAGSVAGAVQAASAAMPAAPAESGVPFGNVFQSMVAESGDLDAKAQQAVTGLLSGSGVEVHDAMIATEKADMAFELGLQMRNKAVAAYQQMMNMQF